MALGLRKRRHCDRGERGQTVPPAKMLLGSLIRLNGGVCLYQGSDLDVDQAVAAARLMKPIMAGGCEG